jgi:hypothetical protein
MAIRLKIPERDHKPLGRVAALPDGDLDALLRALAECQPSLRRRDLVRQLAGKTILSEGELTALLRLFLTLFNLREDYHVATEVLVEEICRAATAVEELGLKSDQEKRERLKARLTRVLSLERSLGATAKALSTQVLAPPGPDRDGSAPHFWRERFRASGCLRGESRALP